MSVFKTRASVGGLMAVIALLGLEFAALRAGTPFWFSAIYTLTVVLLLLATLAARFRRAEARAFWFGFALFGWAYLLLALGPWSSSRNGDELGYQRSNADLLTTRLLWSSLHLVRGTTDDYELVDEFDEGTTGLAHLMITLIFATAGGWVATVLRGRRNRTRAQAPSGTRKTMLLALGGIGLLVLLGTTSLRKRSDRIYFPELAFHREPKQNEFVAAWYSKHLRAMREPSLWELSQKDEGTAAYRLLWLPTFHHSACVRVTRSRGAVSLRVVVLDGLGGYDPGHVAVDRNVRLAESEWSEIEEELDRLKFWTLPTTLEDDGGNDGDRLILEGSAPGRYHVVDRWGPDGDYLRMCFRLADLSGVGLRKALGGYHKDAGPK